MAQEIQQTKQPFSAAQKFDLIHKVADRVAQGMPRPVIQKDLGISDYALRAIIKTDDFRVILHNETERRLGWAAPVALNVLLELAINKDGKTPHSVRRAAASDILTRSRVGSASTSENKTDKPPSELSTEELHTLVAKLESELAERATIVGDNAPDNAPVSSNPLDMLK